jgi:hypothetical protein
VRLKLEKVAPIKTHLAWVVQVATHAVKVPTSVVASSVKLRLKVLRERRASERSSYASAEVLELKAAWDVLIEPPSQTFSAAEKVRFSIVIEKPWHETVVPPEKLPFNSRLDCVVESHRFELNRIRRETAA